MSEMSNDNKTDSLKELEKLLEADALSTEEDNKRLIPKKDLIGMIIRFSAFICFALILYITGIFDSFAIVLVAAAFLIIFEGINVIKIIKSQKEKPSFFSKK